MKVTKSIPAAAAILATGILLSRLLGYVREVLLAYYFGASEQTDAFYAAFQIPDLLNYFLAGGALSIAFIPLYNKVLVQKGEKAAEEMMAAVLGTFGVIVTVATALLFVYAEPLLRFQFPKFDDATLALTVDLTRIVLPAQIFFITGGIIKAVLLARQHFLAAAIAPLVYNICVITGGIVLHACCGIEGFAWGALIGAALGPFLVPVLFAKGHVPLKVKFAPRDKQFLKYLVLALPLMLGQTLLTLDEWYGRWFGALLPAGTVAYLGYARRLMQVPVAIIGQAIAAAALPALSKLWAENRVKELNASMLTTLRTALSLSVLMAAAIAVLAAPGVSFVYEHGAFTAQDRETVSILVMIFAFAVPGWVMQQVVVRSFYARSDTLRPMVLGTILSLSVIPIYLYFADVLGAGGIALAGASAMSLNALTTLMYARYLHGAPLFRPLAESFVRAIAIAGPAVMSAAYAMQWRAEFLPLEGLHFKAIAMADLFAGGLVFTIVTAAGVFVIGDAYLQRFLSEKLARFRASF